MKNGFRLPLTLITVAVAASLAGCSSSPASRFYTLSPLVLQETKASPPVASGQVSVSIAPVEIPDYLDRPQMVTRDGENRLKLAEFDRWGGGLGENVSSVLAENLSLLLNSERVYVFPRARAEKPDYNLNVRIMRLDCIPAGQVLLKAQWTLFSVAEGKDLLTRLSTFSERLTDSKYETMAAAVSRTIEQLSREIAGEITGVPATAIPMPTSQATP
jgi:uncharacterized lipoprotein YmbA